jgi:hypothetical protein
MNRAVALIDIVKPDIVSSQTRLMSDSEYPDKFQTQLDVLKSARGEMCQHPGMGLLDELGKAGAGNPPSDVEKLAAPASARKRF